MRRLSVVVWSRLLFGTTLETRRAASATQDATTRSIHLKGLKGRVMISRDERELGRGSQARLVKVGKAFSNRSK